KGSPKHGDCGLRITDYGLRITDCGLTQLKAWYVTWGKAALPRERIFLFFHLQIIPRVGLIRNP
ncbi:MAG: hypothetical protein L6Q97_15150, partial [Thermoanaerobaculia bacterium]|nr:hypothetical protein [Thermoanaerobaculia bacterium]